MSTNQKPIEEMELHAYIDGQLDSQRCKEVELWLADHPEDAARVAEYQHQNEAMRDLFDPVIAEPLPKELSLSGREKSDRSNGWPILRYAAMAGFMFVGGLIGWVVHGLAPSPTMAPTIASLPQQAAMAHVVYSPEVVHPVEVTADQEVHLTKWLSKRLGKELRVPHLSPLGFSLVGGRLLPGDVGPAAQFMYENTQGKRLTLYVKGIKDNANETAFRYEQKEGVSIFYWVDESLGYALSGEIDKQGLLEAATEVYQSMNL